MNGGGLVTVALEAFKGRSPRIAAIRKQVAQLLARQTSTRHLPAILILGETGTGKGLLARAFHEAGPRRDHPFVDINCAAIPETLLEAELFGYERGAFTDARHAKLGLFQTAHGGTLFLDEIGLLPASLQSKLLSVLEDRSIRRLGSTRAEPIDVMLVAATSVDLPRAVAGRRFREDLYHRVAVITLELPPLRTRGKDVLILADHFLGRACVDYGLPPRLLTPDARDALMAHRWPGNVRELANAMERVALLSDRDEITGAMLDFLTPDDAVDPAAAADVADAGSLEGTLRARIQAALQASGGNIRRTAAALDISRNTLRARMDKYGLRHHGVMRRRTLRSLPGSVPTVASPVLPQWERRHLSFLRVKLLESPTVDVGRAYEVAGEKVRTFGGRIEETSPTGIIAVFGLEPVDNAASHAALAALAIQNAASRAHTAGSDGGVACAIHCADHFVAHRDAAPVIGVDGKDATWSILERMVTAGAASDIVVSSPVAPFLVRRFALERVRHRDLDVWLVLRVEKPAAGWNATRLVGRSSELDALRRAASQAEQRHGQVVAVVGEAGVGKSRLVHEAVQPLQGWLVLSSAGAPFMKDTPFFPVVELLKSLCRIEEMDTSWKVRQRVTRALPRDADRSILAPILDLLRVLPPDDAFRDVDAGQRRKRTHDSLRRLFLAASMAQPLCLIVEDLHWIDSETQEVLDNLVKSITGARVLLLVNYRPEYQHQWGSKTCYSQVRLDALPVESASELLDVLLGPDVGLAPLKQLLVKRGNPFFLEETVRMLVETNALAGERGLYRLTHPIQAIEVPPTVHAMLAARIDRLPPEDRRLLQLASVIGKDVPLTLLEAIADLPVEALRLGLERLQAAEFVYEARVVPEPEYTFKHALTHEVTYAGLVPTRRRELHARIVEAIETLHHERLAEHVEWLSHHAFRGELWDKAVAYLGHAAAQAMTRSADRQAVEFLEQALTLLRTMPRTRERNRHELDLQMNLGRALTSTKGYAAPEVEGAYARAQQLCGEIGDTSHVYPVIHGLWLVRLVRADLESAQALARQLLSRAHDVDDSALIMEAQRALGTTLCLAGDQASARQHLEEGAALYDPDRHRSHALRYGQDSGVTLLSYLAWCLWLLGYPDEALKRIEEALSLARRLAHPFTLAFALNWAANVHRFRRDSSATRATAEAVIKIAVKHGFQQRVATGTILLGWASPVNAAERIARIRDGLAGFEATGARLGRHYVALLAEAYAEAGRPREARAVVRLALETIHRSGEHLYEAELHRLEGECLLDESADADQAEQSFRTAIKLAASQQAKSLELRATTKLARLLRGRGKTAEARSMLSNVYAWFTEGFDTTDLLAAKALLEELSDPSVTPRESPSGN